MSRWTFWIRPLAVLICLLVRPCGGESPPANWPQFRGPRGDGVATAPAPPSSWSETQNIAWRAPMPGPGWSQPIVYNGVVYVTSAVTKEPMRPKNFLGGVIDPRSRPGNTADAPAVEIDFRLTAYSLSDGKELWRRSVAKTKPAIPIHPSNTYATETPVADEQSVYVYFGSIGEVAALTHAGEPLWSKNVGVYPMLENFGTGSSLALHDDLLFLQCFNEERSFLTALDAGSGEERWRATRDQAGSSWSSPLVWKNDQRIELVASGGKLLTGHDPQTGAELWRVEGINVPASSSLASDPQALYFGYRSPFATGPLYCLRAGAQGDISPKSDDEKLEAPGWTVPKGSPGMPSPLVTGECVYALNGNILSCYARGDGSRHYQQRLEMASVAASPVSLGDGSVLIVDEAGKAIVIAGGPEFEILGGGQLNGVFWASPAVAEGALLLRSIDTLYCIR